MPNSSEAPTAPITSFISDLDRLAAETMTDWKVPGAALAVVQDGKVVLTRAYGQRDVEANLPVTPATQFAILSITKSFTATALALLHHEGRLNWSKPVRDTMPEFRLSDPVATERVTVLDLLCHRTGLPRHDWMPEPGDLAPADLLDRMRYLEFSRDIRSGYEYNNLCFNVAGLLIERLSRQTYEEFVRAQLTDKLGMTVGFSLEDLEASREPARPYMMQADTRLPALRIPIRTTASGAMTTSIADFANWMRLHLGKGELDGERLLPPALIGELHAPRVYVPLQSPYAELGDAHYGLGFQCIGYRGDRLVWHGGGWPGWNTRITLVPDFGIGIAVFTNRSPNGVTEALTYYIIDRMRGRDPVAWRERFRQRREEAIAHPHCLIENVTEESPADDWDCVTESGRWRRWRDGSAWARGARYWGRWQSATDRRGGPRRGAFSMSSVPRQAGIASTRCGRCWLGQLARPKTQARPRSIGGAHTKACAMPWSHCGKRPTAFAASGS
jgi:CubicO group peptidase (beta-lactamase class C family)